MISQFDALLSEETETYGIINISVANLRRQPVFQSELVDQIILGTVVPVYEEQNGFLYVQHWDGMTGWVSQASVVQVDRHSVERWQKSPRVIYLKKSGFITENQGDEQGPLAELVLLSTLKHIKEEGEYTLVELPDGRRGFVARQDISTEESQLAVPASITTLIAESKRFLGLPYLWGGTSGKAFDCSGFIQTLFRLVNIALPRNASQIAQKGEEIDLRQRTEGDLLFFR